MITRFFEDPGHLGEGGAGPDRARRDAGLPMEGRAHQDHGQTAAQTLWAGRAHRGRRAHPGPDDLGRAPGLHLPARIRRQRAALLLRRQHGGRTVAGSPSSWARSTTSLPRRAAHGRPRIDAEDEALARIRESERRATATPSGHSSRRSWPASATARSRAVTL